MSPQTPAAVVSDRATTNVKVAIRFRPALRDKEGGSAFLVNTGASEIIDTSRGVTYAFDDVFGTTSNNRTVFDRGVRSIVDSCVEGFNGTIFAYGQTASGKTYTMQGSSMPDDDGITLLSVRDIFRQIKQTPSREFEVSVTYLEVYNEKLIDLVAVTSEHYAPVQQQQSSTVSDDGNVGFSNVSIPSRIPAGSMGNGKDDKSKLLRIVESNGSVEIKGASVVRVRSAEEVVILLSVRRRCEKARHVAGTELNERSSRSHSILSLRIESKDLVTSPEETDPNLLNKENLTPDSDLLQQKPHLRRRFGVSVPIASSGSNERRSLRVGLLHLVDLAGSEGVSRSQTEGTKRLEGSKINQSLLALTRVISQIVQRQQKTEKEDSFRSHITYRDSKLTRLLSNSLGGNSKTAIICCCSPEVSDYRESVSTLEFASRAKCIRNKAKVNLFLAAEVTLRQQIEVENSRLREEVFQLRLDLLEMDKRKSDHVSTPPTSSLTTGDNSTPRSPLLNITNVDSGIISTLHPHRKRRRSIDSYSISRSILKSTECQILPLSPLTIAIKRRKMIHCDDNAYCDATPLTIVPSIPTVIAPYQRSSPILSTVSLPKVQMIPECSPQNVDKAKGFVIVTPQGISISPSLSFGTTNTTRHIQTDDYRPLSPILMEIPDLPHIEEQPDIARRVSFDHSITLPPPGGPDPEIVLAVNQLEMEKRQHEDLKQKYFLDRASWLTKLRTSEEKEQGYQEKINQLEIELASKKTESELMEQDLTVINDLVSHLKLQLRDLEKELQQKEVILSETQSTCKQYEWKLSEKHAEFCVLKTQAAQTEKDLVEKHHIDINAIRHAHLEELETLKDTHQRQLDEINRSIENKIVKAQQETTHRLKGELFSAKETAYNLEGQMEAKIKEFDNFKQVMENKLFKAEAELLTLKTLTDANAFIVERKEFLENSIVSLKDAHQHLQHQVEFLENEKKYYVETHNAMEQQLIKIRNESDQETTSLRQTLKSLDAKLHSTKTALDAAHIKIETQRNEFYRSERKLYTSLTDKERETASLQFQLDKSQDIVDHLTETVEGLQRQVMLNSDSLTKLKQEALLAVEALSLATTSYLSEIKIGELQRERLETTFNTVSDLFAAEKFENFHWEQLTQNCLALVSQVINDDHYQRRLVDSISDYLYDSIDCQLTDLEVLWARTRVEDQHILSLISDSPTPLKHNQLSSADRLLELTAEFNRTVDLAFSCLDCCSSVAVHWGAERTTTQQEYSAAKQQLQEAKATLDEQKQQHDYIICSEREASIKREEELYHIFGKDNTVSTARGDRDHRCKQLEIELDLAKSQIKHLTEASDQQKALLEERVRDTMALVESYRNGNSTSTSQIATLQGTIDMLKSQLAEDAEVKQKLDERVKAVEAELFEVRLDAEAVKKENEELTAAKDAAATNGGMRRSTRVVARSVLLKNSNGSTSHRSEFQKSLTAATEMDYKREQELEIEALESLFANEGELVKHSDVSFELHLAPQSFDRNQINYVNVVLHVSYPPTYPEVAPVWYIDEIRGLDLIQQQSLNDIVQKEVERSLGYPMVYVLADAIQNYISEHNVPPQSSYDQMMKSHKLAAMASKNASGRTMTTKLSSEVPHGSNGQRRTRRGNAVVEQLSDNTSEESSDDEDSSGSSSDSLSSYSGDDDDIECSSRSSIGSDDMEVEQFKALEEKDLCDSDKRITEKQFEVWKDQFEQEMVAAGIWGTKISKQSKLSGRAMFERDHSLVRTAMNEDDKVLFLSSKSEEGQQQQNRSGPQQYIDSVNEVKVVWNEESLFLKDLVTSEANCLSDDDDDNDDDDNINDLCVTKNNTNTNNF